MRQRPWPIMILALFHFLAPLGNGILSAFLEGRPLLRYFEMLIHGKPWWALADFFLLPPLAGWAIYKCRSWSYPIFLLSAATTVYTNYLSWKGHPQLFSFPMFLASTMLDVAFVTYFLLPTVRVMYMDPKMRWWDSKPRFLVRLRGRVGTDSASGRCMITDVSEGGVFIRTTVPLKVGQGIRVAFHFFDRIFSIKGEVVYSTQRAKAGYGVRFSHNRQSGRDMKRLTRALRVAGVARRNPVNWREDFRAWLKTLLTSGKGFTPRNAAEHRASERKNAA